jgi:uncharacterized protein
MTISMYAASTPRFSHSLKNLAEILAKGERHALARKIDPAVLLGARLYPDMFALTRQVQIACDSAKGCVARLAGVEVPRHEDVETTFPELQQRIAKVIAFIESIPAEKIDGSEERRITLPLRGEEVQFTGVAYLTGFALPNFYFHVAMAYAILRHSGVELGKRDYLGNP